MQTLQNLSPAARATLPAIMLSLVFGAGCTGADGDSFDAPAQYLSATDADGGASDYALSEAEESWQAMGALEDIGVELCDPTDLSADCERITALYTVVAQRLMQSPAEANNTDELHNVLLSGMQGFRPDLSTFPSESEMAVFSAPTLDGETSGDSSGVDCNMLYREYEAAHQSLNNAIRKWGRLISTPHNRRIAARAMDEADFWYKQIQKILAEWRDNCPGPWPQPQD